MEEPTVVGLRAHRPLAALARVSAMLSGSLHGPELVQAVLSQVGRLLACDGAFLCEFDESTDALVFRGAHGLPEEVTATMRDAPPLPRGRGTFSQLAQSSQPLVIDDLTAEGAMRSPFLPWFVNSGYRRMLGVPLMREGRTMGGLVVFRRGGSSFSADEVDLLSAFAAECALAMAHVRLFAMLDERSRSLAASLAQQAAAHDVLRVLSVSRADSQPVFDAIAQRAGELCGAEMSAVFGLEGGLIHIRAHHNWSDSGLATFRAMYPRRPGEPSIVAMCVAERRVVHVPDTEHNPQVPQDSLQLTRQLSYRAVAAVPMLLDGAPIGAIGVMRTQPGAFSEGQIALLQNFADQAVVAVETARLFRELQARNEEIERHRDRMEGELQLAREIQLGMVPGAFPPPTAARPVRIAATLEPAREIGGDLYDFFWRRDGRLAFVVADVSDKGAPAALHMARTKTLVRALALHDRDAAGAPSPARVLDLVNQELCADNTHTMFVTVLLGLLDPHTGELLLANAGHPAPLVVRPGGDHDAARVQAEPLAGPRGAPLGVSPRSRYADAAHRLADTDTLVAYTDGITEAADATDAHFGEARLAEVLQALKGEAARSPDAVVPAVMAAVRAFAGAAPQADDIAVLALQRVPAARGAGGAPAQVRLELPAQLESLAEVAAAVDTLAEAHALPERCWSDMQVVLDEALSNIVQHAPPAGTAAAAATAGTLRVWLSLTDAHFIAEIEDDGPPFDPTRAAPPLPAGPLAERRVGGLGLHLMRRLCSSLDYAREGGSNRLVLKVARTAGAD